jgi:hypothetical protein
MNFLKKWFYSKCEKWWEDRQYIQASVTMVDYSKTSGNQIPIRSRNGIDSHGIQFTLHRGNGGHALELREYDTKTDRNNSALHIIPTDQDLGQAIAHIITYEGLKK